MIIFGEFSFLGVRGLVDFNKDELAVDDGIVVALGRTLKAEFGEKFSVYDEEVKQGVKTPCFFISCAESKERQYLGSRYFYERKYLIKFYPESSDRKKCECDEVSKRLFDCLLWIGVSGQLLMGRKMSSRYENGVLSFFVNYDGFFYRQQNKTPMGELTQHSAAKG